jgi:hypothetical protein
MSILFINSILAQIKTFGSNATCEKIKRRKECSLRLDLILGKDFAFKLIFSKRLFFSKL